MDFEKLNSISADGVVADVFRRLDVLLRDKRDLYVAYSGGVDSTCLLCLISLYVRQNTNHRLFAIHIDHGVSESSKIWQEHCKVESKAFGAKFITETIKVSPQGEGFEYSARKARMRAFFEVIDSPSESVLFLGHHAKDQVETLFLRVLRGCGLSGLCSIYPKREYKRLLLLRPLLFMTKEQVNKIILDLSLSIVEDDSNASLDFDRNYILHELLPSLQTRWPHYQISVAKSLLNCQEDYEYLKYLIREKTKAISGRSFGLFVIFQEKFTKLPFIEQSLILRTHILDQGWYLPSSNQIKDFIKQVNQKGSLNSELKNDQYRIVLGRGNIHIFPANFFQKQPRDFVISLKKSRHFYACPNQMSLSVDRNLLDLGSGYPEDHKVVFFRHRHAYPMSSKRIKSQYQSKNIPLFLRPFAPFLLIESASSGHVTAVSLEFKSMDDGSTFQQND